MNTQNENTQTPRPFGYWIKAVDRLMAAEFATAFESEGATRRDWRLLNVIDGTAPSDRPLHPGKLHGLVERGWVAPDGDGWTLTDEGRAAKDRLGAAVDGIRATMTDAAGLDDLATTLATLEKIAVAYGWDESTPLPRGRRGLGRRGFGHRHPFGRRHGFGPEGGQGFGPDGGHGSGAEGFGSDDEGPHAGRRHGFGRGFRPGFRPGLGRDFGPGIGRDFGPGFRPGFGPGFGSDRARDAEHGCRQHGHGPRFAPEHGHDAAHGQPREGHEPHRHAGHRAARAAQHAYERGFDAGYSRGRDA
ncbi:MarR family winged helix-turn-helix transcriptional regulator [Microbacterium sp. ZW T5_45]|uniref:MarR family winged helix-turn-helix transcriptional regulator n=1 Tax=Microbacterium sp. ZW T5_45 TaxID=3378080 RepID=UPI0038527998